MSWQLAIVIVCVLVALAYIVRATWRTWHPKPGGCGGGCGCKTATPATTKSFVDSEQLGILRR